MDTNTGIWVGLTDEVHELEYRWLNGDVLSYDEWKVNEPNGGRLENCVAAIGNQMTDFPCSYGKYVLCSTIGRNKYIFPLQVKGSKEWLKAGFSVFVASSVHNVFVYAFL